LAPDRGDLRLKISDRINQLKPDQRRAIMERREKLIRRLVDRKLTQAKEQGTLCGCLPWCLCFTAKAATTTGQTAVNASKRR
jgi:hypothetical protein